MSKQDFHERQFFRIQVDLPVTLMRISRSGDVPDGTWIDGQVTEIGAGGLRIQVDEPIDIGDILCLKLIIPDTFEETKSYARVVGKTRGGEICAKFVGLSESQRKKIIQYGFREQIRRRKMLERYKA